ncbi:GDSL esterase/lipase CPRD49 [Prunus yedoensis var. nudiflora]|uniref:GDSL esterase/lipase CPRD49 n=1 Tax=Prunus yedoensis var. nudiflora TaxID=2094558 RepID=A0A314UK70_PRUYE|nr:GDSL esterase/lipase CPRD49 [Prunus yedoensis var. nudiflora]
MVGPLRPQFVLFGSSIVQFSYSNGGWGAILADLYSRKADVLVRGYAGWNSRRALQVLEQVFPKDAAIQPSLVIVYFGGNDSMLPHSSGLGPIDIIPERNRTNESCRIYSDACLEVCRELDVKAVDLWTSIQRRKDWSTACFTDGIHFSAAASKIVAEEILKVLREADWEPSLHWKSLPTEFAESSPYDPPCGDGTTLNIADHSVALALIHWGLKRQLRYNYACWLTAVNHLITLSSEKIVQLSLFQALGISFVLKDSC